MNRFFPWLVLVVGMISLLPVLFPARDEAMHIHQFGNLCVIDSGRYKPLDSFARDSIYPKVYRHTVPVESKDPLEATPWLLDIMAHGLARFYNLVNIPNPEIQAALGLKARPNDTLFGLEEIRPEALQKLFAKAEAARSKKITDLSPLEKEEVLTALDISERTRKLNSMETGLERIKPSPLDLKLFRIENDQVLAMLGLERRSGLRYSYREIVNPRTREFDQFRRKVDEARKREPAQRDLTDVKALQLAQQLTSYLELSNLGGVKIVPGSTPETWQTLGSALMQEMETGKPNPRANSLTDLIFYYASNQPEKFNKALDQYQSDLRKDFSTETRSLGLETFYNDFNPFYCVLYLYVTVFILLCFSWFGWQSEALRLGAVFLGLLALTIHTWGLGTRMVIQGRPPVTNLYSSALFIGWGCVVLAIGMEFFYRNTFAMLVGSILGFITLLFAPYMLEDGKDSMEVLVAVLDTNFWLATHVVCITLGYTTTFLAGFIGLVYILWGLFTGLMTPSKSKNLGQMLYGVLCFATLLSFVGTVLGGIWADQSWGRFWGWDPKENGAIMIVIWNALILHARWAGLIKVRGMAMLALVGNMITAWSWAGTNQLGIGLHAYGFNNTLATGLVWFWFSQLAIIGLAMIPQRFWASSRLPDIDEKLSPLPPIKMPRRSHA